LTISEFYDAMCRELIGDMSYYTPITCQDGFSMSVQASSKHYCHPREDGLKTYTHYEVGFPSENPTYFADYADQPDYTNTVYAWVPVELIVAEINYHGDPLDV